MLILELKLLFILALWRNSKGFFYALKMKSREVNGVLLALGGILLFSSKAVFAKLMYAFGIHTIDVLVLRMGIALPFYLFYFMLDFKAFKSVSTIDRLKIVAMGVIGYYLASYFDFKGLEYIDASLERLVLFAYPTFVVLLNRFVFKIPISKKQVLAIGITYLGVVIVFAPQLLNPVRDGEAIKGMSLVLLSAFTYGAYLVFSQNMMETVSVRLFTSMAMIVSTSCTVLHYFVVGETKVLYEAPVEVFMYGAIIAVFATVIPSYLISAGISKIGSSRVAILGALGPVSTISLAYFFIGEELSLIQVVGASVIVLGVFQVKGSK